jgi:energy-coupling factor transporter transmembrane protein EcfT
MKQNYSTGENEIKPPIFDKINWHWVLPAIVILGLVFLIILALTTVDIVGYIGFAVFFGLGFILGQSKIWLAIRRIWREVIRNDVEED